MLRMHGPNGPRHQNRGAICSRGHRRLGTGRVIWTGVRQAFDSLMADMADRTVGLAAAAVQLVGGIEGQLSFGWQLPSVAVRKKGLIGRCGVGYQRASDPRPTLDRP